MVLIYKCVEDNGEVLRIPEIRVSQIKEIAFNERLDSNKTDKTDKADKIYDCMAIISENFVRKEDTSIEHNQMMVIRKYVAWACSEKVMTDILNIIDRYDSLRGNSDGKDDCVINLNATDYADLGWDTIKGREGGYKGILCRYVYDVREMDVVGRVM